MDVRQIAPGATFDREAGYWVLPNGDEVVYPESGHEFCASVEDQSFWFAHRSRMILEALRRYPPAGGPLFDVGGGNGYVALALQRAGFPTVIIEPDMRGAANAVRRGVSDVVRGTLPSDAVRREAAGGICLFDVLEHVEGDRDWLTGLLPYLKPGGRIYLTTPAYRWLWSDVDTRSGHYRRYTLGELRRLFASIGVTIDLATYIFTWLPPAMFIARRLRRGTRGEHRGEPPASRQEHMVGGSLLRRLATGAFAFEANLIARGKSIPFGATCLVVARRGQPRGDI